MDECLSENQIAELLSGVVPANDQALKAHLDRCPACLAIVAAILKAEAPASHTRFAIVRRLGAGGMGTVYEALDRDRKTRVALKVLRDAGPETILRFKREFRALHSLHHPNLVRIDELVAEGDRWCFTMELLDGVRFLDYVRPANPAAPGGLGFDDARLRDAFRQLVHGLAALHAAGKVHRDVKPSNVLVTGEGRVVLIDLGLVLDQRDTESSGGNALGTVAYMAPEQALGRRVGPEADWYATGVILYQALTGRQPFTGDALEIAAHKQRGQVAAPRELVPAIHAAWNDLCLALLSPSPTARPAAAEILRALDDGAPTMPMPAMPPHTAPFVGRDDELAALARALDDTRQGRPVVVFVTGEPGIGKTTLGQRFADDCRGRGGVVLAGRCYEHESMPFKAVDGIVDALSRHLTRVPLVEAAAVLPRRAALLARGFPVLARVKPIAEAPHRLDVDDPQDLRASLLGALRELLARLADRRPLVLVVDDVRWEDADAFALLAELFHPPEAPALLLVVTGRGGAGATPETELAAARHMLGTDVRELPLSSMVAGEARALASRLIAQGAGGADLDPAAVADEAQGHPLFIAELVRASPAGATRPLRLEEVLAARVAQLAPATRTLLHLAALVGGRLRKRTAALAADLDSSSFEHHLSLLRAANLARTSGPSGRGYLEPYHDRVRAAILAHLGGEEARGLHGRLAMALEAEAAPDADVLARHWSAAGERARDRVCGGASSNTGSRSRCPTRTLRSHCHAPTVRARRAARRARAP